ncbi:hypothetical protein D3C87_1996250 [compost metagenome]
MKLPQSAAKVIRSVLTIYQKPVKARVRRKLCTVRVCQPEPEADLRFILLEARFEEILLHD